MKRKKKLIQLFCIIIVIGILAFLPKFFAKTPEEVAKEKQDALEKLIAAENPSQLFKTNCTACHGDNAQGGIGPNLTDDFWIYDATPSQIEHNVANGILEKGMPPFNQSMDSIKIKALARYVFSLKGTNQQGKAPQGYPYKQVGETYSKTGEGMRYADIEVPENIPVIDMGGDVENGRQLFNVKLGCAHCHGTNAVGHIDNRNVKETSKRYGKNWLRVVDQVLYEGRKGTAMPQWAYLKPAQLRDLKAFVVSVQEK